MKCDMDDQTSKLGAPGQRDIDENMHLLPVKRNRQRMDAGERP